MSSIQSDNMSEEHSRDGEVDLSSPSSLSSPHKPSSIAITTASGQPKSTWRRVLSAISWFLIDQWFLLALGMLVLIASQVQVPASQQGKKEIVVTYLCVAVIFIVTGCTLSTRVLMENYSRWLIHLFVQIQSFLMTSAVIYGVVIACATNREFMDPGLLVGQIFTGCVPTTISSNIVMTKQAHGNQALTVVQSTLGNLLGPFISPLLIQLYTRNDDWWTDILPKQDEGAYGEIYRRVFKQLGLSIFLPMVYSIPSLVRLILQTKQAKRLRRLWVKLSKTSSPKQRKRSSSIGRSTRLVRWRF